MLLRPCNGARFLCKIRTLRRRPGLDAGGKGRRRRQALPEFIVEVARERTALFLLDLEQTRGQRGARRVGAFQILGELIKGAGDQIEFTRTEAR